MSTNVHYTQISEPQLLDIVDEAWLRDKLPDDNIPLPPGMQGLQEDLEELQQEQQQPPAKQKERWLDMGLPNLH
ncbi:hypothetical protein OEZ85_006464 [Tetradesmus obliquus]|uniref:Anaphase-promoting complex subunit 13 n=1 Tax=Tetradesmus obliquus TaxID=3088 RepID=A0ABY8TUP0_TETOB|nr:hypothetical protein OEZ85_006464 [Tetradesmus obliquus]